MMVKAVKEIKEAMFPVFRRITNGEKVGLGVAGTGFFINSNGVFITTAHIFDEPDAQTQFVYHGRLPDKLEHPFLPIQELTRDDERDIFIGRVNLSDTGFLQFASDPAEVGKTVCIAGYPLAQITINAGGGFELGGVRRYFQPSFILDFGGGPADNGAGLIRNHQGFLIRDFGLFGMSGGPVVDVNGRVLGMQAAITNPRESTNGTRTITVENAVAIGNDRIIRLLEDNKIDYTVEAQAGSVRNS
jgi:S1-C subfamily serine protease